MDEDVENIILTGIFRGMMDVDPDPENETILEAVLDEYEFSHFYTVFEFDPFLSTENSKELNESLVYPNPTPGVISTNHTDATIINVYTMLGTVLWTGESKSINLSKYNNGQYIIEMNVAGKNERRVVQVIR